MRGKIFIVCSILLSFILNGQENDTIVLDPLLITGQVVPTKINESVYAVEIISKEQIEQSAANNLADLLNQSLNIQITPNNDTGKYGISMFGLNSEYVKVLVDNIPLVNDEGFGNFTDFSQINLENIEQIEIVEGSMGVEYGANAVGGVINIITKKNYRKLEANVYVQEESVGDEYKLYGRGRHIKGLNMSSGLAKGLTGTLSFNKNDFDGWFHEKKGQHYYEEPKKRGHEFRPKLQYDAKANLNYRLGRGNLFYTINYFNEEIEKFNDEVQLGYNPITDLINPSAQDERFKTNRWRHHLNYYQSFAGNSTLNISASYQSQKKDAESFTYYIIPNKESNHKKYTYESREVFYAKALFGQTVIPDVWELQISAEANHTKGKQSPYARGVDSSTNNVEREQGSYDVFSSSEVHLTNKWTVRPGVRALFSSQFDTQLAYSLSSSYKFSPHWELRAMYGSAPKHPTYEQLYTYFVDSNHYVVGNENLDPETSKSVFVHLFYNQKPSERLAFAAKLSGWFIRVEDQINLVTIQEQPLQFGYKNFDNFDNQGISLSGQVTYHRLSAQLGVNYSGESYESNQADMLYSWNANMGLNYHIPLYQLSISTNIKRNGKEYKWRLGSQPNELIKGTREAYTWWDMSIKKDFLKDWEVVVGARNLLDVKDIKNTTTSAGAHQAAATTEKFAYGRSYFIKLTYHIPF